MIYLFFVVLPRQQAFYDYFRLYPPPPLPFSTHPPLAPPINLHAPCQVLADRFAVVREEVAKEYANMKYQQPYQWAMYRRELLTQMKRWRVEEYEPIAGAATAAQLTEFIPRMMLR